MIGFFQNTMAKHHRLMFGLLLVIIVVSFVFYTGSGSAMDLLGFRRSPEVCGVKLNEREADVYRKAVALTTGRDVSEAQYRAALVQRVVLEHLADAYQIPNPSQEEFGAFAQRFFGLAEGEALPDPKRFGMDEDTLKTILIQTWRIGALNALFSGSPASFDEDVALRWRELNTRWTVETASLALDKIAVSPVASDEALEKFYAANVERYRIAPLVRLSYAVVAPSAEARAKIAEPTDAELKTFARMQDKSLRDDAALDAELAKNRAGWARRWKADRLSLQVASATSDMLAEKLAQDMLNPDAPDFDAAVKASGLDFKDIPAFPTDSVPADAPVPAEILRDVTASLNSTLWRTDAIPYGENALVILFRGNEPSRVPALDEVRARVAEDWKRAEIGKARFERARELGETLRGEVAAGKPFAETAKTLGMTPAEAPAFSMRDFPDALRPYGAALFETLKTTRIDAVSDMLLAGDSALFVRPLRKDVPAADAKSEELAQLARYLDAQVSAMTLNVQLGERVGEELFKVSPRAEAEE